MNAHTVAEHRTYGGWLRPKSFGLPGLGTIGTVAGLGVVVIGLGVMMLLGLKALAAWLLLAAPPIGLFYWKNRSGRDGWTVVAGHAAWLLRKHQGTHVFLRSRIGKVAHGTTCLPGLLAKSELLEAEDGYGQPFGIICLPSSHHYTVMIAVEPDGDAPVGQDTRDTWVANFGHWLGKLQYEESLVGAAFTCETRPDPGHVLSAEIDRLLTADGPDLSKRVLEGIRHEYPRGAPQISAWVSLTYSALQLRQQEREISLRRTDSEKRPKDEASMAALIAERLPGQLQDLASVGVSAPRVLTAQGIADQVRVQYDPHVSSTVDACHTEHAPTGITWDEAGPTAAITGWDWYKHDGAASVTYEMASPPSGAVQSTILGPLLNANDRIDIKRVSMLYRPHSPDKAPAVADRDRRTALGISTQRKGETRAADETRLAAARQAAAAQAAGAGMVRFSLLVTCTVLDPDRLKDAAAATQRLGRASQVALRPCRGVQDSAFAACLGVGVVLSKLTKLPSEYREWM